MTGERIEVQSWEMPMGDGAVGDGVHALRMWLREGLARSSDAGIRAMVIEGGRETAPTPLRTDAEIDAAVHAGTTGSTSNGLLLWIAAFEPPAYLQTWMKLPVRILRADDLESVWSDEPAKRRAWIADLARRHRPHLFFGHDAQWAHRFRWV
ncbi:MAG: hypothetical protein U0625_12180 [Phycisphaerales bacterium]